MTTSHDRPKDATHFWTVVLPIQTLLLTAYVAPVYGFNALIQPINRIFSPGEEMTGWSGSIVGAILFLGIGLGALLLPQLKKIIPNPKFLLLVSSIFMNVGLALAALACWLDWFWLMIVGLSVLVGFFLSNFYSIVTFYFVSWGQHVGRVGLISGVVGLCFGIWAALYSFFAPLVFSATSTPVSFLLTIVFIVPTIIGIILLKYPEATNSSTTSQPSTPNLGIKGILGLTSFWLFFVFFLLFLTPGFGFKIIVQAMILKVYDDTTQSVASIIAVAFLGSYGISRLIFGITADKLKLKLIFLIFCGVQCLALLGSGIAIHIFDGPLVIAVLMCITGAMFGAGKSLWTVLIVNMYGPVNYTHAIRAALPAYGLAGFFGPLTLAFALRSQNVVDSTSIWFFGAGIALLACFCLIWLLRVHDYEAYNNKRRQKIKLWISTTDERSWF